VHTWKPIVCFLTLALVAGAAPADKPKSPPARTPRPTKVVKPGESVRAAVAVARPGAVILLKTGTYPEAIEFNTSGTKSRPITLIGEDGVVIDGTGHTRVIGGDAKHVFIRNITVRGARGRIFDAAVKTGDGWRLEDVTVERADAGGVVVSGRDVTLLRVTAQDCGQQGIMGKHAVNATVKDCVTRRNNRGVADPAWKDQPEVDGLKAAVRIGELWYVHPDFEAGGGKWWECDGVVIDGMQAYENTGPQIWFDYRSKRVTIRNCEVHDAQYLPGTDNTWQATGIRIELQDAGPFLVEKNKCWANVGANVTVEQARNVTIQDNELTGGIGVLFRDHDRGKQYRVTGVTVRRNVFDNSRIETWEWPFAKDAKRLTIDGNTYKNAAGAPLIRWDGKEYAELPAGEFEKAGVME
jgi:nitrous oxidase accessory protein NosD